ncbi:hypothetical protein JI721_05760 [Alicyclobacillus cycloheptanicus]|uniref:Uncharacterized protein n=1 Tax=Alicyclobacillus cycloheptanicus TaxID=1457 RepID=A0ABT9XGL8_9BACL|nr:hypothetical protein [Alicyclobacillus cycloheptanicus]MDQ0189446.1 hypothetical protein [Alicyclobacillus cycloheptanicus]WDM02314.1 hypothetical protein JI721_05760 [Alicyclobacillus cycloheptanicus]
MKKVFIVTCVSLSLIGFCTPIMANVLPNSTTTLAATANAAPTTAPVTPSADPEWPDWFDVTTAPSDPA